MLVPSDRSGVWLTRTIHTYTKLSRILDEGGFGKASVRECRDSSCLQKKKKKKYLLVRRSYLNSRLCGANLSTIKSNLLLKKRIEEPINGEVPMKTGLSFLWR